jgi:hypothetical protein
MEVTDEKGDAPPDVGPREACAVNAFRHGVIVEGEQRPDVIFAPLSEAQSRGFKFNGHVISSSPESP